MYRRFLFLIVLFSILFISCKKEAGEGGKSTITGTVWTKNYNETFTVLESEYWAADEWVYIVYGDNLGYGDRQNTTYNGTFEFKYLRPGKYTIYVYSKDSTLQSPSGKTAIVKTVEITKRKQTINLPKITIYN